MERHHGPYYHGLGKQSPSDISSEDCENENFVFHSPDRNYPQPSKKTKITHLDAEIIPKFDPGKKSTNVKSWLHKIDQLGDLYDWEERDKIFVMQTCLHGAARDWYDDLNDYDATWNLWKERLTKAFPRSTDFVDRLEEMLARLKNNNETMTRYYHDKISLMKKCGIEGEDAISCLIRGLTNELRANAKACCTKTPEELYYSFLSSLENYKNRTSEEKSTWQRGSTGYMPKTCYNCRKTGHTAPECRIARCQVCQRLGHAANTCWYATGSSRDNATQGNQQISSSSGEQRADNQKRREVPRQFQDGRVLQVPLPAPR